MNRPTAKDCNDPNWDGGVKKSDRNRDCGACWGTGKKLSPCPQAGCISGYMGRECKDEFHNL